MLHILLDEDLRILNSFEPTLFADVIVMRMQIITLTRIITSLQKSLRNLRNAQWKDTGYFNISFYYCYHVSYIILKIIRHSTPIRIPFYFYATDFLVLKKIEQQTYFIKRKD